MAKASAKPEQDVALVYAPTDDGEGARILRARKGRLEAGEVRPMREGKPLMGAEIVRLSPRQATPAVCDVEVLHERAEPVAAASGPAKVANDAYRRQWDRIFKKPKPGPSSEAN